MNKTCDFHDTYNENCVSCRFRQAIRAEGIATIQNRPQIMNILETHVENMCLWYDGTLKPMRGHTADCKWRFDGFIWEHL